MTEKEFAVLEQLSEEKELFMESDCTRRDLKERRGMVKSMLYDGSKKLKHSIPKGKRI